MEEIQWTPPSFKEVFKNNTPLSSQIEKEVTDKSEQYQTVELTQELEELQKVYDKAELMLKTGKDIEAVCQATSLPTKEVKLLAKMVEREAAAREEAALY